MIPDKTMIRIASRSQAKQGKGQDRIKVSRIDSSTVAAVLADGEDEAAVVSGGARAAELVVEKLSQELPADYASLFDSILDLDRRLQVDSQAGLTTVVAVYAVGAEFFGAVIGDSDALLITNGEIRNLGAEKEVEPLLGDGEAFPTMFSGSLTNSVLLLCSDGLSKYIQLSDVLDICSRLDDPSSIADGLLGSVELLGTELQDDVSIVVMRS